MIRSKPLVPAVSTKDAIRRTFPAFKKVLGWFGLALTSVTSITFVLNVFNQLWLGLMIGIGLVLVIIWGQWVLTPFDRRRRDLEQQGWYPLKRFTLLVGYYNPKTNAQIRLYSWHMFFGWWLLVLPDALITLYQTASFAFIRFINSSWRIEWVWIGMGILGIISVMASIGPENIIFKNEGEESNG